MQNTNLTFSEWADWIKNQQFFIDINAEQLTFLLLIAIYNDEKSEPEISEAMLIDLFRYVASAFKLPEISLKNRCNNAINDLVTQNLMHRFANEFTADVAIYRLTSLGKNIAKYFIRSKEFSKLKISRQLNILADEITLIATAAQEGGANDFWHKNVMQPLQYSVADMFDNIDLSQRMMDEHQKNIQKQITELLTQNWYEAIHSCENLLNTTSNTLNELQQTITTTGDKIQEQLLRIQNFLLEKTELTHISQLVFELQNKLDGIVSWGQKSIDLWINYDKNVHKFIRTAIDLDKNRVFSERLHQSIKNYFDNPWFLYVLQNNSLLELKDEKELIIDYLVVGELPTAIEFESLEEIQNQINEKIEEILLPFANENKPIELSEVLKNLLSQYPADQHFNITKNLIDKAVTLGISSKEMQPVALKWQNINNLDAKIQANVIDEYHKTKK